VSRAAPKFAESLLGFTLAEAIIVIVITGILAAIAGVFITRPIQGYFDTQRRAQMSDIADTALRRIARDVQAALPNSVRIAGGCGGTNSCYLEFIPTVAGGRYRAELKSDGTGDKLDFTISDTSFDIIGPALTLPTGSLWLVVYNLGIPGADAYSGASAATDVRRAYSGASGSVATISFTSSNRLPFESPSRRFQMVSQPVTYECAPSAAGGELRRYQSYGFNSAQIAPPAGTPVRLATQVTNCVFTYSQQASRRAGLLSMSLGLTQGGESVSLFSQVHVGNVP
jgi:MSHA biogenesis protein MshO